MGCAGSKQQADLPQERPSPLQLQIPAEGADDESEDVCNDTFRQLAKRVPVDNRAAPPAKAPSITHTGGIGLQSGFEPYLVHAAGDVSTRSTRVTDRLRPTDFATAFLMEEFGRLTGLRQTRLTRPTISGYRDSRLRPSTANISLRPTLAPERDTELRPTERALTPADRVSRVSHIALLQTHPSVTTGVASTSLPPAPLPHPRQSALRRVDMWRGETRNLVRELNHKRWVAQKMGLSSLTSGLTRLTGRETRVSQLDSSRVTAVDEMHLDAEAIVGPPPSDRTWVDEWAQLNVEQAELDGVGDAFARASLYRHGGAEDIAVKLKQYRDAVDWKVRAGWQPRHAEAYTLISCCGVSALARALAEGDDIYAASTHAVCEALASRAALLTADVSDDSLPPPCYCNLRGMFGLASEDPTWAEWLSEGAEPGTRLTTNNLVSATANSKCFVSSAGFGVPNAGPDGTVTFAPQDSPVVLFESRRTTAVGGGDTAVGRSMIQSAGSTYDLPPLATVELERRVPPGEWEAFGVAVQQELLVVTVSFAISVTHKRARRQTRRQADVPSAQVEAAAAAASRIQSRVRRRSVQRNVEPQLLKRRRASITIQKALRSRAAASAATAEATTAAGAVGAPDTPPDAAPGVSIPASASGATMPLALAPTPAAEPERYSRMWLRQPPSLAKGATGTAATSEVSQHIELAHEVSHMRTEARLAVQAQMRSTALGSSAIRGPQGSVTARKAGARTPRRADGAAGGGQRRPNARAEHNARLKAHNERLRRLHTEQQQAKLQPEPPAAETSAPAATASADVKAPVAVSGPPHDQLAKPAAVDPADEGAQSVGGADGADTGGALAQREVGHDGVVDADGLES